MRLSDHGIVDSEIVADDLRKFVQGDVLARSWERAMYATDASSYEILPLCVVAPKTKDDVVKVVKYCYENSIPIVPRGGGSGLAGQAIGSGIILDLSKWMNRILDFNPTANYVTVEPGIYKSVLDHYLKSHGKFLPPDPSSAAYCTVGGMIATNASGPHTVKYGSTIDYLLSITVVLSNGSLIDTRPIELGSRQLNAILGGGDLQSEIYRKTLAILTEHAESIKTKIPVGIKNSSGFRLERVLYEGFVDLSKLFACSEGTLGIILQATLRILDVPTYSAGATLYFDSYERAAEASSIILEGKPSALEMVDRPALEIAEKTMETLRGTTPPSAEVVLLVEFDGSSESDVNSSFQWLKQLVDGSRIVPVRTILAADRTEMSQLWETRKKTLPLVHKLGEGDRKPLAFIEDVVVPPKDLPRLIRKIRDCYAKHNLRGVVYGHAGDGHIHARPLINVNDPEEIALLPKIASEIFSYVVELGGSITGEHGDGLVRSDYVLLQYDETIYKLFVDLKKVFDPKGIMNPGKKLKPTDGSNALLRDLRYEPHSKLRHVETALNWGIEANALLKKITGDDRERSYRQEVELCHGCGKCRPKDYSIRMCPVFKAFGNEVDSCRGRNNVLRWMLKLRGLGEKFEDTDEYRDIIYKHCIQCKMCHVDCPSNVNVAKLMAEARARYAAVRGLPKGYKYFVDIDRYGQLLSKIAPVSNRLFRNYGFRTIMEWVSGIDKRRNFPEFSRRTFKELFDDERKKLFANDLQKKAVFFYDTYINFNNPQLGMKIVRILARNGYETIVPPQVSSGLPALVEGAPEIGRRIAEYNVANLAPYAEKGIPIIVFSPSAGITLKMEYLNVLDTPEARTVADATRDLHEFLWDLHNRGELDIRFQRLERSVNLHLHCHHLVQRVQNDVSRLLGLIPGLTTKILERGCCGVGGSFSFIKGNYDLSMAIGQGLFEAVRDSDVESYSTGESCKLQIEEGSGRPVGLTVELLSEAYGLGSRNAHDEFTSPWK